MSPRMPGCLAQLAQDVDVVVEQLGAACSRSVGQAQPFGQLDAALVGHLEEEQVRDLLDVVAVVDAVVAQGVAEAPELLDDVGHAASPTAQLGLPADRVAMYALHSLLVWPRFADHAQSARASARPEHCSPTRWLVHANGHRASEHPFSVTYFLIASCFSTGPSNQYLRRPRDGQTSKLRSLANAGASLHRCHQHFEKPVHVRVRSSRATRMTRGFTTVSYAMHVCNTASVMSAPM